MSEVADTTVISALLQAGVVPVLCPPGVDRSGDLFNINADTIALEIALALGAEELLLLTGSGGVLDREGQLLKRLDRVTADRAVDEGWIAGGMKVKTDIGFKALDKGVKCCLDSRPDLDQRPFWCDTPSLNTSKVARSHE